MATSCKTVPLSDRLVLIWRVKVNWQYVEIDPASIPWVNEVDVCECLENCQTIESLRANDAYLSSLIKKDEIDIVWIKAKNKAQDEEIQWLKAKDNSQDSVINMINTEISWLKTEYINVMNKLEWMWVHVILDEDYLSFDEWCQNVYIPNCWLEQNSFKEWDWYFNWNQSIAADQAVYVNVRSEDSTEPCSADDWYRLPYSLPTLSVIWIDPVYVSHPYKWRFEVWIDKLKLADLIADMEQLDLSNVKVYLWDVYLDWVIKESLKIQESLQVWNEIKTKDLVVEHHTETESIHAKEWCIEKITCDTEFEWDIKVDKNVEVIWDTHTSDILVDWTTETTELNVHHHIETESIHADEWCIERFTCDTDHWWNTIVTWDTIITNNSVTTIEQNVQNLYVNNDTHLDWPVTIRSNTFNLINPDTWEKTCLQNLAYNSFNPSYWFFTFSGWADFSAYDYSTSVVWLWSNIVNIFNDYQNDKHPEQKCKSIWIWTTKIDWDKEHTTSWVWMRTIWNNQVVIINWWKSDYAGIYRISFQLTLWFNHTNVNHESCENVYAHRAWVVVIKWEDPSNPENYKVYDDKHAAWRDVWDLTLTHHHLYSDYDYDDIRWSSNRINVPTTDTEIKVKSRTTTSNSQSSNFDYRPVIRSDDHYTYCVTVDIPVDWPVILAPFVKLSSWFETESIRWSFTITDWEWISWWLSRLSVVKISNLAWPHELHCED